MVVNLLHGMPTIPMRAFTGDHAVHKLQSALYTDVVDWDTQTYSISKITCDTLSGKCTQDFIGWEKAITPDNKIFAKIKR
jgi:hypothetical protein